jgi:transposase
VEAARHFKTCWKTVSRYCKAAESGSLSPKPQGGSAKRFSDEALRQAVRPNPSATLKKHAKALGVNHVSVWNRLRLLGIVLKKNS